MQEQKLSLKISEIVTNELDKKMVSTIEEFLKEKKGQTGPTEIQIRNFILNEPEYPTEYGKFQQVVVEMEARFHQLVDNYYAIKVGELELQLQKESVDNETNNIKKKIAELNYEQAVIRHNVKIADFDQLLKQTRRFYNIYESMPQFHKLTDEEREKLEAEQWAEKSKNMPLIFEERYGEKFMKDFWGQDLYNQFKSIRQSSNNGTGMLPREIVRALESEIPSDKLLNKPDNLKKLIGK